MPPALRVESHLEVRPGLAGFFSSTQPGGFVMSQKGNAGILPNRQMT